MKLAVWRMLKLTATPVLVVMFWGSLTGAAETATVKVPINAELYASAPQPLTPVQCGQCHEPYFNNLKHDGGKHRFACQECHKTFHAYNPTKGVASYQALMPKCASCHDLPHGKAVTDCASCHNDPHAIKKPIMSARLVNACSDCHAGPKSELIENPSKHTKMACDKCHTSHGLKPNCNVCHKAHYQEQGFDTCTTCHQVHKPKLVTYGNDTQNTTCASCHPKVADKLRNSTSKHSAVSCASCHKARHKAVPQCTECHESPHPRVFLEKYPVCLTCHLDPHDPISKNK